MSAQSWSVKGIDPKVREAVREAAARQGMSLGEYLNQALLNHEQEAKEHPHRDQRGHTPRPRPPSRLLATHPADDLDDWLMSAPADMTRNADPARMAHRLDTIERRTQLAVTGLDRAVSTIDRSVLGLAGRVDDAEEVARESAERISDALDQFRAAGEILSGRLTDAEDEARQSRERLDYAARELSETRADITHRVNEVSETARRAEQIAKTTARETEERQHALHQRIEDVDADAKYATGVGLAEARAAAEAAARAAAITSTEAVEEIRALQQNLERRVSDSEAATRDYVSTAIENTRSGVDAAVARIARGESEFRRAYDGLSERVAGLETGARFVIDEATSELRAAQTALSQRIEKAELAGREGTAGLRQAAGAAIADLRNAQLGLSARLKIVEEASGASGAIADLTDLYAGQATLADRLAHLEETQAQSTVDPDVAGRIARLEAHVEEQNVEAALARFDEKIVALDGKLADVLARPANSDDALHARLDEIWSRLAAQEAKAEAGADVSTLEQSLQRLAERIAETESTANTAIRTLEETVAGIDARLAAPQHETEAVRTLLEQRLNEMAQQTGDMVQALRAELASKADAAREGQAELGVDQLNGLEGAIADVNQRLAAAERRQAQTIEAISVEIKRMSETVDRRLRAVETNEGGDTAVREEITRLAHALEHRFEEIERREAAAFDRMGLEVGRLSERLDDRVGAIEGRSAQAIEQVGEQVARMAERFNQRQETLARELGERVLDSEERSQARIADAISGLMERLNEVETQSVEAVTPVARAMSTVASRLQALEDNGHIEDDIPTPHRRAEDPPLPASVFGEIDPPLIDDEPEEIVFEAEDIPEAPLAAAPIAPPPIDDDDDFYDLNDDQPVESFAPPPISLSAPPQEAPVRAGPLAPGQRMETKSLDDPFADDLIEAPPAEEEDPFWLADEEPAAAEAPPATLTRVDESDDALFADDLALTEPLTPAKSEKSDYLSNARRAAQAAAQPAKPAKTEKQKKPKKAGAIAEGGAYSIRGSSRVVLWGAAATIVALVAGGAYVMNRGEDARPARDAAPPQPYEPSVAAPPVAPFDGVTPEATDGLAPQIAPDETAPLANAAPAAPQTAAAPAQAAAAATPIVAGPLPPRSVSLDQAAARGDAVAQYELALQRIGSGRAADGVALLRQSANQGLAMAQYRLAKLYERGEGVPTDLTTARTWTERAAAAGNRRAMHDLGVYFARGEGAPLDEAAAFRWFRQAAELGVADSQFNLGILYQQGRGVGANPSEALFWFLVAARQGDEDAGARADSLENQLQPIQVEQARARAGAFRPRAASARANGEFGPRPWAATPPRS